MQIEFPIIEGKERFSNKWRNIVFAVLLLFGVSGGLLLWRVGTLPQEKTQTLHFGSILSSDKLDTFSHSGGDIVVPPKVVLTPLPQLIGELPLPETFTAARMFVKDKESGVVLYTKDGYTKHAIASITKLMSALVLLEHDLPLRTRVSAVQDAVPDSHVFANEDFSVEELWQAALIGSSNRAILSLVDASSLTREQFVERMNQKAVELGMTDTLFVEPTGLDERNVSTGSDITLLLAEALRSKTIAELTATSDVVISPNGVPRTVRNTDWFLLGWIPLDDLTLVGGKTGFIDASGYNFAGEFTHPDGRTVDVVVLGAGVHEARFTEARDIASAVFAAYTWPQTYETP